MDINLTITLIAVFTTVGQVAWTVGQRIIAGSSPTRRRLDALARTAGEASLPIEGTGRTGLFEGPARKSTFIPLSPKSMGQLQRRLTTAGYQHPRAVELYFLAQV